ncbi:DNA/RNA helicase domain-containing protein [Sphaerisporangium viridialbum]|uniref:DNA/RNA helicase domain-containing protein n=1 Tax=Sphaerisporangium viridialbum TaxID=46189 RepID=UPI003C7855C5
MEKTLIKLIADNLYQNTRRVAGPAEKRSWLHSLSDLARVLNDAGRSDIEVLVEYPMPHNKMSCADAVLAGVDAVTGEDIYVVVELKQWSEAGLFEGDPELLTVPGLGDHKPHPASQVKAYRDQIADNCGALEGHPEAVKAVVYLHNATHASVQDLGPAAIAANVQLFTMSERGAFIQYLRGQFADEPGGKAADRLLGGPIRPTQHLLRKAADVLRGKDQFVLLDRQIEAFRLVMHNVRRAYEANTKRVVIITGGPGSGKSAIAISLLKELAGGGDRVAYATGSRTVTKTLRREVGGRDQTLSGLFKYYMEFANAHPNRLDVLIADEAHRVRKKSFDRFNKAWRSERPQIESIIDAARVPVFLLDEHQVVKPDEVGTIEAIKAAAQTMNVDYQVVELEGQWRCGGSAAYDLWVRRLLSLGASDCEWDGDADPEVWKGDDNFEVILADSPGHMDDLLRGKLAEGRSARITAGYCWKWSKPNGDKSLVPDIRIDGWQRPWNARGDSSASVGDAPSSHFWATAPGGFEQVGCVYTAQGLEFDWAGVIVGPDLIARNGRLRTVREASEDRDLNNARVTKEQLDRLVRNTYKVLLTRGLSGVVIYAVDQETRDFLAKLIDPEPTV